MLVFSCVEDVQMSHPVLCAVGVELQRVEALWRTGDLSLDLPPQETVSHRRALPHSQDLQRSDTSLAGVTPAGPPPPKVGPDWLDLPWGSNRHPQLKS
ncbi:hypothetical protein F7725_002924 [Dissostichus mawsoni]|uniref:Uncharacterized protein n=1 Tax=Dissostichus mawsoni TaxID=36200 RepID=A0A7J5Y8R7_DISMA|nr:hypothetical protein F7725_002924 [Dissostichus mawsoni]